MNRLGDLTESELQQVYLVIGVRIGVSPSASAPHLSGAASSSVKSGGKQKKGKGVKDATSSSKEKTSGKGNPSRKSQWANHPLYKEYATLKKTVETQAKEQKLSFAAVVSPEKEAYNLAFTRWMEAKSSFRDRKTSTKEGGDEQSQDEEGQDPVVSTAARGSGSSAGKSRKDPTGPDAAKPRGG
jgi:hypothetical protein